MHEQSLVRSLLDQVDRVLEQHPASAVVSIHVELGPLSGVEPCLLESAFQLLAPQRFGENVILVLDEVPLQVACQQCKHSFDMSDFVFRCPTCGSRDVRVVRGDCLQLMSISLRAIDPDLEPAR